MKVQKKQRIEREDDKDEDNIISSLPDCLLTGILSYLPIRDSVATSVCPAGGGLSGLSSPFFTWTRIELLQHQIILLVLRKLCQGSLFFSIQFPILRLYTSCTSVGTKIVFHSMLTDGSTPPFGMV
nr:hypothetical protein CFP56_79038 [Quercus suber]